MPIAMKLQSIIKKLIDLKKEGVFWDYKEEHHNKPLDLIHDVTCLANAKHNSNRYIIFGVNDEGDIIGLKKQKKQADIIDTLRSANYADDMFPDIILENLIISKKELQILIIKDKPVKPYYLSKDKDKIRAGTIYSRTMDTNTPKNRVASSKEIEYMWKERFGLVQSPLERFEKYLKDFDGWINKNEIYFYTQHPEFTIQPFDDNYCRGTEKREWARSEPGYYYHTGNATYIYGLYYHTTLMKTICCVQFDGGKKTIVNPDWEAIGKGRIYFYLEDSLEFIFQQFLSNQYKIDDSKNLGLINPEKFDIPIFANSNELASFLLDIKKELLIDKENFPPAPENDETKQNDLFHSYVKYYKKWKIK